MVSVILANVGTLFLLAVITEALTEVFSQAFPDIFKGKVLYATSIVVGITLAFVLNVNLFALSGVYKYASYVCAGLLGSRGANFVNGFAQKVGLISSDSSKVESMVAELKPLEQVIHVNHVLTTTTPATEVNVTTQPQPNVNQSQAS